MPIVNSFDSLLVDSSTGISDLNLSKIGICCWQCGQDQFEILQNLTTWTYNYRLAPQQPDENPYPFDWAASHGMEFVPMSEKTDVMLSDGWCSMLEDGKYDICTVEDLVSTINSAPNSDTYKYLMGFNEPYTDSEYVDPTVAAELWARYFIPTAQILGLQLVSPTTSKSNNGVDWLGDFLMACVDLADDAITPCDYTSVTRFSIHDYDCNEATVNKKFGPSGTFNTKLIAYLGDYGNIDWSSYVLSTPYWLTETNCNWGDGTPNNVESCQRITGQDETQGNGSVYAWTNLDQLERLSWWNVISGAGDSQKTAASAMMNSTDNSLYPVGRAFVNLFDATQANCTAEPTNDEASTPSESL